MGCNKCCPSCDGTLCAKGGASTTSCMSIQVAGVSGTGSTDCAFSCADVFNGLYFMRHDTTVSFANCSWYAEWGECLSGCEDASIGVSLVKALLQITKPASDYIATLTLTFYKKNADEVVVFKKNYGTTQPPCLWDAEELTFSASDSTLAECVGTGATATVSVVKSSNFSCVQKASRRGIRGCAHDHIPWNGVEVEIAGVVDDTCATCDNINGIYILSGPPYQTSDGNIWGWEIDVSAGCGSLEVVKLYVQISNVNDNVVEVWLYRAAGGLLKWRTFNCLCDEFDEEPTAIVFPFSSWSGCDISAATVAITAL